MRGIRVLTIGALMILMVPARPVAEPLEVISVLVTGAFRTGEAAVRSMLLFRDGSTCKDQAALDRAVAFSRARMEQTGEYTYIDIFVEMSGEGNADVTVSVAESFISPVGPLVLFPNLPFYGASLGFLVSGTVQAAAMGVLLPYPFDAALVLGNRLMGPADGLTAGLVMEWTPTPELAFLLFQDASYALTGGLAHDADVTSAVQASLDCTWLANVIGLGFSLWGEARKGWYEYAFTSVELTAEAVVRPFRILSLTGSANAYSAWGDYPPYGDAPSRLAARLDSAPCVYGEGPDEVSLRLELLLGRLFQMGFIPLKPGVSVFGFTAAGSVLPDVFLFDWSACSLVAGGGVEIRFPSPVSLSIRAGWSHAIAENKGTFFVGLK